MSKTLEERVDILLMVGTESPKKWMKVHGYAEVDPDGTSDWWHSEWKRLRDHHLDETGFLFEVVGELVKRLNRCPQCAMNTLIPSEGCLLCPTCGYSKG